MARTAVPQIAKRGRGRPRKNAAPVARAAPKVPVVVKTPEEKLAEKRACTLKYATRLAQTRLGLKGFRTTATYDLRIHDANAARDQYKELVTTVHFRNKNADFRFESIADKARYKDSFLECLKSFMRTQANVLVFNLVGFDEIPANPEEIVISRSHVVYDTIASQGLSSMTAGGEVTSWGYFGF